MFLYCMCTGYVFCVKYVCFGACTFKFELMCSAELRQQANICTVHYILLYTTLVNSALSDIWLVPFSHVNRSLV